MSELAHAQDRAALMPAAADEEERFYVSASSGDMVDRSRRLQSFARQRPQSHQ
jgi:hypothetical protein